MSKQRSTRRRRARGIWFAGAAIVVIGLAAVLLLGIGPADDRAELAAATEPSSARNAALTVTTVVIEPVQLKRTVTVNGSIYSWQEVIISPEVGGYRVAEVNVDVGDHVAKGQELVRLSSALLSAEVATKEAALKQRKAEAINAEASLRRARTLSDQNLLSQADLDQLSSAELAAQALVDSAEADLETSKLRLEFTHVLAPDDGVITARSVTVGQIAQVGSEMLRLQRKGRVEWRGEVPEARLAELSEGQTVTVTTADGSEYQGNIRIVAPTIASSNRTGLVYVDLESDAHVRPGMFARGEIEIGWSMGYTVPLQSVVNADGYSYVFVVDPETRKVDRRRIETGAVRGTSIEVMSGLAAGDTVVGQGAGFLKDGDLVNVAKASGL